MNNIAIIAAHGLNYELGKDNDLIWKYKEDLQWFKNHTLGKVMVMGRKTFESLPGVLPNREHWILTKDTTWSHPHPSVKIFYSIDEILTAHEDGDICVIGGGEIYRLFLPIANVLYITRIHDVCESADTFFPHYEHLFHLADEEQHPNFTFTTWHKKVLS